MLAALAAAVTSTSCHCGMRDLARPPEAGLDSAAPDGGDGGSDAVAAEAATDAAAADAGECAPEAAPTCAAPPVSLVPPACYRACQEPEECVWVNLDCCTCLNGGGSAAINAAFEAAWTEYHQTACSMCTPFGCDTVVVCPNTLPACVMGVCQ